MSDSNECEGTSNEDSDPLDDIKDDESEKILNEDPHDNDGTRPKRSFASHGYKREHSPVHLRSPRSLCSNPVRQTQSFATHGSEREYPPVDWESPHSLRSNPARQTQSVATHRSEREYPPVDWESPHSLRSNPAHQTQSSNSPTGLGVQAAVISAGVLLGAAVIKARSSSSARSSNDVPPLIGVGSPTRKFLTDGYISHTFSPQSTEMYLAHLFKIDPKGVYAYLFERSDWPRAFVVFNSPSGYSPPIFTMAEQHAWVLDYAVVRGGSVVPQELWLPQGQGDRRRFVEQANFSMPVFFINVNGTLGVPVVNTTEGLMSLQGGNQPAPLGGKAATTIYLDWPGYPPFKQQVQLRDQTPRRNPVTLQWFVRYLGRCVKQFIIDCEYVPALGRGPHKWTVGSGRITLNEVVLIGVVQVPPGGWTPILQLESRVVV
ncbi:hypothetical protein BC827DRAFT_1264148 [Russula dissimulans]|nr:hypothetical protein BC827DRAFT_1264148 [Russula dissimulans]